MPACNKLNGTANMATDEDCQTAAYVVNGQIEPRWPITFGRCLIQNFPEN